MAALAELPKLPEEISDSLISKGKELRKVETSEKNVLPTKEDVEEEKKHVEMITGIEKFDNSQLKTIETAEKVVLPTSEDIKAERQHLELTKNIESFTPEKLKHTETHEKNMLPSKTDIAREKTLDLTTSFDKTTLKHVEPIIKTQVEVIDA
ncbi:unnamed protein product [Caenorhabditis auriculariae]|uniref:Thymosin beta n=1 Tax=Caenorhabditis auriculariae TaxID=2777116 RepID=A0A8S1GWL6_9PELO|nr:unnamed protein product [Caenorhabditis auriculariae]